MGNGVPLCVFVSVVRDRAMDARLVRDNPNNVGGEFVEYMERYGDNT